MRITGTTTLYGLLGDPVAHSLSPFIMNRAFAEHECNAVYTAFRVVRGSGARAVQALRTLGAVGVNATYPLKEEVLSAADAMSPEVEAIGAANTLRIGEKGIEAHNTDAEGMVRALALQADTNADGKRALVVGAGGAARAAIYGLLAAGAASVIVVHRSPDEARTRLEPLGDRFGSHFIRCVPLASPDIVHPKWIEESDILINATPIGMGQEDASIVGDEAPIASRHCCLEFVYHPRRTAFLDLAERKGARIVDGLAVLAGQAQIGFQWWTGFEFSWREMYDAASAQVIQQETMEQPTRSPEGSSP